MSTHVHGPQADSGRRLLIDAGLAVVAVALLVAVHNGLYSDVWIASGLGRAVVWLGLSVLACDVSGRVLFAREERLGPLPISRFATGALALWGAGCGLWELFDAYHLSLYPAAYVAFGGLALLGSVWSDSVLLAILGAELVDQWVVFELGSYLGIVGGHYSSALFLYALVAAVEMPLGWRLARRTRRALGLGVLCNGGLSLVWSLLRLGTYGPELHGVPSWTWISWVYFGLALGFSVLFVRAFHRLKEKGSWDFASRTVIVTITYILEWTGMDKNQAWLVGIMAYWAIDSSGALDPGPDPDAPSLDITPEMLQDPAQLQALFEQLAAQDPAGVRLTRAGQRRAVRAFQLGLLGFAGFWGLLGMANLRLPSADAFRVSVYSARVPERLYRKIEEFEIPDELRGGQAIDAYLVPYRIDRDRLIFSHAFVVERGAQPPAQLSAENLWKVPGRVYDCRRGDGKRLRGVMLDAPDQFGVPEAWHRDVEYGDELVFAAGWAGYPFADRYERPAEDPEDPDDPQDPDEPDEPDAALATEIEGTPDAATTSATDRTPDGAGLTGWLGL